MLKDQRASPVSLQKNAEFICHALDAADLSDEITVSLFPIGCCYRAPMRYSRDGKWTDASPAKFKGLLEEFYSDSPERLKAAMYGLKLAVKKPSSDTEQD